MNEEDPHPDYVLIDTQSPEGQSFARQWVERGAPSGAFVSWTYVTACICENSLVNASVVQNTRPALIDPDSQQPLLVNINSSLDGLAKVELVERIGVRFVFSSHLCSVTEEFISAMGVWPSVERMILVS